MDFAWDVVPLARNHRVRQFDCGDEDLNRYLRQFAEQHARRGVSRTYVAIPVAEPTRVIGYVALATGAVAFEATVSDESLPRFPVPVLHMGRLAVASEHQGHGAIGRGLLAEVYDIGLRMSESVGCCAIDVIAKTERAARFYERQGFVRLNDSEHHLWIRMKDLRASRSAVP